MAEVLAKLDKAKLGDNVQPLFISIDPKRDTVDAIAEYVAGKWLWMNVWH